MVWVRRLLLIASPLVLTVSAQAEEKEPTALIEIGGAGEWGLPGGFNFGPSVGVEFTPIKEWLEIETSVAPLLSSGRTEWDTDLFYSRSHSRCRIKSSS